jgi:3-deoxy-D-manno-octulosonic-acid transferase
VIGKRIRAKKDTVASRWLVYEWFRKLNKHRQQSIQMGLLYDIGIRFYTLLIFIACLWNPKARKWIKGRRDWKRRLSRAFSQEDQVIWFHCASLGEFEQGRPVLEMVRKKMPGYKILLTFFSPSGYEKQKDNPFVDAVFYLPSDTYVNARDFLTMVPVSMAFFIKYEFWYNYLNILKRKQIPTYLISGHFTRDQLFFKWYGAWYRKILHCYAHIFVQHASSIELLRTVGIENVTVAGDTRFDRVIGAAGNPQRFPYMDSFASEKPVIVAGSTWEKDEQLLAEAYHDLAGRCQWVIAPHEIDTRHIERLKKVFPGAVLFSEVKNDKETGSDVIIVDSIGQLLSLYSYGTIAYVGGGFGKGIHNLLEPAVHGLPVIFGPNTSRFREAADLVGIEAGHRINADTDLSKLLITYLDNPHLLEEAGSRLESYFKEHSGASGRIVSGIFSQNINIRVPEVE